MTTTKDYYAILGVLPSAEDIVIRAAYRALAQRYHPDKWSGEKDEAERRMKEINEACAILSDSSSRVKYDAKRKTKGAEGPFDTEEDVRDAFEEAEHSSDPDWAVAVEYFPDLALIYAELKKTSVSLAFSFKTILLESKKFMSRNELAESLRHSFLETYFGSNPTIIAFAKELIASGEKETARELNRAVVVLGSDVAPDVIIGKLKSKYRKTWTKSRAWRPRVVELAKRFVSDSHRRNYKDAQTLIEEASGSVKATYEPTAGIGAVAYYEVSAFGEYHKFANQELLFSWLAAVLDREVLG